MRLFFFFLLFTKFNFGQDIDIVRQLYLDAGKDRLKTTQFVDYFSKVTVEQNILLAYQGTALAMIADLEKGNLNKYKKFVEGREKLEAAITKDFNNLEIRYLRFAVQSNIPRILGYNNLKDDKEFILGNINSISSINNKQLQEVIFSTLLSSKYLTKEEKNLVESKFQIKY